MIFIAAIAIETVDMATFVIATVAMAVLTMTTVSLATVAMATVGYRDTHFSEKYFLLGMNFAFHDANFFVSSPHIIEFTVKFNVSH